MHNFLRNLLLATMALTATTAFATQEDTLNRGEVEHLIAEYENSGEGRWGVEAPPETIQYEIITDGDSITQGEVESALSQLQNQLTDYASSFVGTPYRWGATGPKRFDCSGFTSWVFKHFGYDIGRTSRNQSAKGQKIGLDEVRVGDLMFFSRPGTGKNVGHVGMVVDVSPEDGSLKFIHASSRKGVTVQKYPDNGYYQRRFLHVRRVIDEPQEQANNEKA